MKLVHDVKLEGEPIDALGFSSSATGRIPLERWQLPVLRELVIAEGEEAPDIPEAGVSPPDHATGPAISVPIDVEEC